MLRCGLPTDKACITEIGVIVHFILTMQILRGHWVCTTTVDPPGEVKLCDSIGNYTAIDTSLLLQISNVYSAGGHCPIRKVRRLNVQQQTSVSDCGCFAVAFATEICQSRNPCDACFDQGQMRIHLYKCLQRGEVTAFPQSSVVVETVPRPMTQLFTYTLNIVTVACTMNTIQIWFNVTSVTGGCTLPVPAF